MPDNLKISLPVTSNDSIGKLRNPLKGMNAVEVIDPTRVNSKTSEENAQKENYNFNLNQNSVFNKFVEQLTSTPQLSQTLKKILFDSFLRQNSLTRTDELSEVLGKLNESMKLTPEEMTQALKFQEENQTCFSNKIFSFFRALSKQTSNPELKEIIGHFLKSYNGYFTSSDTLKYIKKNLNDIMDGIPLSYRNELKLLTDELADDQSNRSLDYNLFHLKEKIVPFLSDYISKTNDFGRVRDTITLLLNNLARLNTSSLDDLSKSLENLLDYCRYHFNIPDEKIEYIKMHFEKEVNENQKPSNELFDNLVKTITEGLKQDHSSQSRSIYRDISNMLLLDHSVFMPLGHLVLPLNYNGTFMFSEIWIDKNDETNKENNNNTYKNKMKLFITFDIKNLGYFETTVSLKDKNAEVEISYPIELSMKEKEIKENIMRIFEENTFNVEKLILLKGAEPKPLDKVFVNLYERKRAIDVTV